MNIEDVMEWIQIAEDANYSINAVECIRNIEPIKKVIDIVNNLEKNN